MEFRPNSPLRSRWNSRHLGAASCTTRRDMSYPYGPPPGSRGGYGAPSRPPPIPPPHAYPTPPSSGPSYGHPPPMNPGGPPPAGNGYYPPPQPSNTNAYHSHLPGLPTFPPPPTQAYAQTRPPPSQQSYNESYASSLSYPSHSAAAPPSRDQYDSRQQQGVAALGGPTGGRGRGGGRGSAGRRMGSPEGELTCDVSVPSLSIGMRFMLHLPLSSEVYFSQILRWK